MNPFTDLLKEVSTFPEMYGTLDWIKTEDELTKLGTEMNVHLDRYQTLCCRHKRRAFLVWRWKRETYIVQVGLQDDLFYIDNLIWQHIPDSSDYLMEILDHFIMTVNKRKESYENGSKTSRRSFSP